MNPLQHSLQHWGKFVHGTSLPYILISWSSALYTAIFSLAAVERFGPLLGALNILLLAAGLVSGFIAPKLKGKLIPLIIIAEAVMIIAIAANFDRVLVVIVLQVALGVLGGIRIPHLSVAVRVAAVERGLNHQSGLASAVLITSLLGLLTSFFYPVFPLIVASIVAACSYIISAILFWRFGKLPEKKKKKRKKKRKKKKERTNNPRKPSHLVLGGFGFFIAIQLAIAFRPALTNDNVITAGFYIVTNLSTLLAIILGFIQHVGNRSVIIIGVGRIAAPLFLIALCLTGLTEWWGWVTALVLCLIVETTHSTFLSVIHDHARTEEEKVQATALTNAYWRLAGITANVGLMVALAYDLTFLVMGIASIPAFLSLCFFLFRKRWHLPPKERSMYARTRERNSKRKKKSRRQGNRKQARFAGRTPKWEDRKRNLRRKRRRRKRRHRN